MSDVHLSSWNEAFNARNLSPQQVGERFIRNQYFDRLLSVSHSVLMGPRGSGKTTLLKMLTLPALRAWKNPESQKIQDALPFTAVYIPTDVHWHHQLNFRDEKLASMPD